MKKIAILASGNGSNAVQILAYFLEKNTAQVAAVLSNKKEAPVLQKFEEKRIPAIHFTSNTQLSSELENLQVDYVVLAGYLKLIPVDLIQQYKDRMVNIHPSLLPNYGGKGMYGMNVHKAVLAANETVSGITIHLVNEEFDKGRKLFQASVQIGDAESTETIAQRIQKLEHTHYPRIIEKLVNNEF